MGWVQQGAALGRASGVDQETLRASYLRHSDFGDAAAELLATAERSGAPLTVSDVAGAFEAVAGAGSGEQRIGLLTDLFARATPEEARFIGRVSSRETRIGLREGLLEEAVATAFDADLAAVRRAHMLTGEIGEAAILARDGRLAEAALHLGRPIRFMLATPVADAAEVMRRVGDEAWIEDKYDGIRAQLHIEADGTVRLFSRDLNDVTRSFPEIAEAAAALTADAPLAIDGELVPWRQGSVLDFASLQTRLGRVRPSAELLSEVPVVLVAFDLLHAGGAGSARDAAPRASGAPRDAVSAGPNRRAHPPVAPGQRAIGRGGGPALRRRARAPQRGPHDQGSRFHLPAGAARDGLAQAQEGARDAGLRRGRRRVGPRQAPRRALRLHVRRPGRRRAGCHAADHRQGLHRPHRCRDRRDDGAIPRNHAEGLRPLPDRGAGGGGRDRLRSHHAIVTASVRVRHAFPAHRAHPRRQDTERDRHHGDGGGAVHRAGDRAHPAGHRLGRRDRADRCLRRHRRGRASVRIARWIHSVAWSQPARSRST